MALVKFITVYDDESLTLINEDTVTLYNISLWPSAYDDDTRTYIDYFHTNSVKYYNHKQSCDAVTEPGLSYKLFQLAIEKAYNDGYSLAMIVCPNRKWYPYYKEAVRAVENFKRRLHKDFTTFRMCVVDTKAFAAGSLYHTLRLARMHVNNHCPTGIIEEDARSFKSKMLCLTESGEKFGYKNGRLSAFRVFGKRFYNIDVSESVDYVVFENFAKSAAKFIRLSGGKYLVSVGADCTFAANILGRIERIVGVAPIATVQYGVASAGIFGLRSICIHLIE